MSVFISSTDEPTITLEDLHDAAKANNFTIESGSSNEDTFLMFANSFDSTCQAINDLPEYEDPRTAPVAVEGGERTYYRPSEKENPLNAWMYRTNLRSSDEKARKGPLAGKTIAVKDNMSVAGLPIGLGTSEVLFEGGKHPISPIDATVVRRILEAGATITGTTTCENLSIFPVSYSSETGVVHNAWLPGYATGGSTAGAGALLSIADIEEARKSGRDRRTYALGEDVDLALGGDQGGSIRLPAAYSGFYGMKGTYGLIPYTGIGSLHPMIDHVGPMARTVEDIAELLGVLAGYDGIDPRMTPESPLRDCVPDYSGEMKAWMFDKEQRKQWDTTSSARGLRIGVLKESLEFPLESSCRSCILKAIERFKTLGADVSEVSVPLHKSGAALWGVATKTAIPGFLSAKPSDSLGHTMPHVDLKPIGREHYDKLANRNPSVINILLNAAQMEQKWGNKLARKAYMHVLQLRAAYDEALKDLDVLITPMTPTVGPKIPASAYKTAENPDGKSERILDLYEQMIGNTVNTCPFNLSGHPAMSMPVGWGDAKDEKGTVEGKLPVGLQLVAKRWDELSLLKAAKAWEVGGHWMDT